MEWIAATVMLLVTLAIAFQMLILLKARKTIGQSAPDLSAYRSESSDADAPLLLYFHSHSCAPCRRMSPVVELLAAERADVVSVDISSDPEAARRFNIRATPTTILVEQGRIKKVMLGFQSEQRLRSILR